MWRCGRLPALPVCPQSDSVVIYPLKQIRECRASNADGIVSSAFALRQNELRISPSRGCSIVSLAMDAAGQTLVTGTDSRHVHVWCLDRYREGGGSGKGGGFLSLQDERGQMLPEMAFTTTSALASVSLSHDGGRLVVGTSDHTELYALLQDPAVIDSLAPEASTTG